MTAHLEYMPPILSLVIETFVQDLHDLDKVLSVHSVSRWSDGVSEYSLVVSQLCDFMHLPARRGPWVVGRCIADLGLGVRIAFGVVFGHTEGTLAVVR